MKSQKPRNDITGKKFGRLTTIRYLGESMWECECECGNKLNVLTSKLTSGHTRSCGCLQKDKASITGSSKKITVDEIVGRKYGYLEVIDYDESDRVCTCRCDCGNIVLINYEDLKHETIKSCGCKKYIREDCNLRERICQQCGKKFEGGPRAFYCPECRAESKKKAKREYEERKRLGKCLKIGDKMKCEMCGKEIIRGSARQRFCEECAKINLKEVGKKQSMDYYKKNKDEINEKRRGGAFKK